MDTYRYRATTESGEETAGVIDAASFDEALEMLLARNLREVQVYLLQPKSPPIAEPLSAAVELQAPVELTASEAGEFSQHVAQISSSGIPLAAGLRAAAEETGHTRIAVALCWIADQIDRGRTLEETLTESDRLLPPHITGLILAAARTGSLGEALFELVELQQKTYTLRREISRGYVYPLVVITLAASVVVGIGYYLAGMLRDMYAEFELQLPLITKILLFWREQGVWIVLGVLLVLLALALVYRLVGGPVRWRQCVAAMPLFGTLSLWTGVAEWSGLMSVLLRHRVPLPEALRWAGRGSVDASVEFHSLRMADGVARGRLLSQMIYTTPQFPSSVIPLVEWGEKSNQLSDSFRVAQEMLQKRARLRAMMLQSIVPPLLFLGVGSVMLFIVVALFSPMIDLISALS